MQTPSGELSMKIFKNDNKNLRNNVLNYEFRDYVEETKGMRTIRRKHPKIEIFFLCVILQPY